MKRRDSKEEKEKVSTADETIPRLDHQLTICRVTNADDCPGVWYRIAQKPHQRLRRVLIAFGTGIVLSLIALCFLYLPDFAADYAHRGKDFILFFVKMIIVGVVLIGGSAGINAFLKDWVLYVNPENGCMVNARRLNSKTLDEALTIKDCTFRLDTDTQMFHRAQILISEATQERPIADAYGDDDIRTLHAWLTALQQKRGCNA